MIGISRTYTLLAYRLTTTAAICYKDLQSPYFTTDIACFDRLMQQQEEH